MALYCISRYLNSFRKVKHIHFYIVFCLACHGINDRVHVVRIICILLLGRKLLKPCSIIKYMVCEKFSCTSTVITISFFPTRWWKYVEKLGAKCTSVMSGRIVLLNGDCESWNFKIKTIIKIKMFFEVPVEFFPRLIKLLVLPYYLINHLTEMEQYLHTHIN